MAPAQSELLPFLQSSVPTPSARVLLKRTMEQFVLEYGWWKEPVEVPSEIEGATISECHKNATDLMLTDNSLIYCEGYALFQPGSLPTRHAWVTDGHGRAIDNTWPQSGVAYAGVPFKGFFVSMTGIKNHATISRLDYYQNGYPLRGELGDRPDEWLELRGRGLEKLTNGGGGGE